MRLLLLYCCFFRTFRMFAQDTPPPPPPSLDAGPEVRHHHKPLPIHFEAGLNTLQLAKAVRGGGPDSSGLNPWVIDGRLSFRQFGIRGSFGGSYKTAKNFIEGFRDSETVTTSSLNWRGGLSYRTYFSRRFSADFGLDYAVFDYRSEKITDSGFDVIKRINQSTLSGGGLSVATSWWITRRLGVKLEMSYYYLTGEQKQARQFVNFPELDDQIDNFEITEARLPVGLFITFRL